MAGIRSAEELIKKYGPGPYDTKTMRELRSEELLILDDYNQQLKKQQAEAEAGPVPAREPHPLAAKYIDAYERPSGDPATPLPDAIERGKEKVGGEQRPWGKAIVDNTRDNFNKFTGNDTDKKEEEEKEPDPNEEIKFTKGLFTKFLKDYSKMTISEYTKQNRSYNQTSETDPLMDIIRGNPDRQGG